MTWGISLVRADAVTQGSLVLAQYDGLLGPWRVTDVSLSPHPADDKRLAATLTLVQQGVGRPSMMQLHEGGGLVPVLVPLPDPEPEHEAVATLRLKVELA